MVKNLSVQERYSILYIICFWLDIVKLCVYVTFNIISFFHYGWHTIVWLNISTCYKHYYACSTEETCPYDVINIKANVSKFRVKIFVTDGRAVDHKEIIAETVSQLPVYDGYEHV